MFCRIENINEIENNIKTHLKYSLRDYHSVLMKSHCDINYAILKHIRDVL